MALAHQNSFIGFISRENLRELLGQDCAESEITDIIKSADADNDGKSKFDIFPCFSGAFALWISGSNFLVAELRSLVPRIFID